MSFLDIVILAAGLGTRMHSSTPKVLLPIAHNPVLAYVLTTALDVLSSYNGKITVVLSQKIHEKQQQTVEDFIYSFIKERSIKNDTIDVVYQEKQCGTGDAIRTFLSSKKIKNHEYHDTTVVLFGDTPFIQKETIIRMILASQEKNLNIVALGFRAQQVMPGYGRIFLHENELVSQIIEEKDQNDEAEHCDVKDFLYNAGAMTIKSQDIDYLVNKISTNNKAHEFYATDMVHIACEHKLHVGYEACLADEALGINTQSDLTYAERVAQNALREKALKMGVRIIDPQTVYLSYDTYLEPGVIIEPFVYFGPGVKLFSPCHIKSFSYIENTTAESHVAVGPFAHLRDNSYLEFGSEIGNFVELKNTRLGQHNRAKHLTYLGDTTVQRDVNIGAGTVTCNYDGFAKYKTFIGARSFIGSNTTLVAPLTVAEDVLVGAGSVVTRDIPEPFTLTIARSRQINKSDWVKDFHLRKMDNLLCRRDFSMDYMLIIDFGSQFTTLIKRIFKRERIACVVVPYTQLFDTVNACQEKARQAKAIILSGGPFSIQNDTAPLLPDWILELCCPILGICYGQQILCRAFGASLTFDGDAREFGRTVLRKCKNHPLFDGLFLHDTAEEVWMSHSDHVKTLPKEFDVLASSNESPFAVIVHKTRPLFGLQFHPEVAHSPCGKQLLFNFACKISCITRQSNKEYNVLEEKLALVHDQVGKDFVLCAVSGGVDSSVLAILLHKALGARLTCIFVDTGLLRKQEAKDVIELFNNYHKGVNFIHVDAKDVFLNALESIVCPEKKRKLIGKIFIDVFVREAKKLHPLPMFLAQGTLYSDVIESSSSEGAVGVKIKSHHNVGGLPDYIPIKLLEPFRDLFKDDVQKLGTQLGLPLSIINKHPFPGPGLAIRILGAVTKEGIDILQCADAIYISELRSNNLYESIWQAFCVLLPVKTVGVMGDSRTYEYVCSLRAVTSLDGMTADFYPFSSKFLGRVATRIINEVQGINRVVYDITSKPPGTIEWE